MDVLYIWNETLLQSMGDVVVHCTPTILTMSILSTFIPPELVGALVGIFIVVLFYEGLKMTREVLLGVTLKKNGRLSAPNSTTPLLTIQQAYKRYSNKI